METNLQVHYTRGSSPTFQHPSAWRLSPETGWPLRTLTPLLVRWALRAWGNVSSPPRSDHWLQRSARAWRISAESGCGLRPAPISSPSNTERWVCSAWKRLGKQDLMLSSRLLPANTPRQRLSMARDATLRARLGLRGQGISCTNFHCPAW